MEVDDWFKMVWAKITKFFTDLGEKIKEAFKEFGIDMKDFGKKVKEAFDKLGVKIKEFFDKAFPAEMREKIKQMFKHYGDVIVAEFNKLVEKYKDLIISALLKDGKVIIAEGVKLIVDLLKKITGNDILFDDLDDEANDIKDLWKIIKAMVEAWAKEKEAELEKLVTKN